MKEVTSLGLGNGASISRRINAQAVSGSGELNESHSATNAAGDYVNVSAHLDDSTSWIYNYDLTSTSSYVSGQENVKVVRGTGLDFRGEARSSSGSYADVSAVGGANCPVSMTYSNSVRASSSSAIAAQVITGASTAGRAQGCTDPLIIRGSARPALLLGAPSSHVDAGVLGGSRVSAATLAGASPNGYGAAQFVSAAKYDDIWNKGSSEQVVAGIIGASVGAGASNGTNFASAVATSFISGRATAGQIASGRGEMVYKFSNATGGLYNSAGTNTTVQSGSLITADVATAKWNSSQVAEAVVASGEISRRIFATAELSPGLKSKEVDMFIENGRLIGSAKASSTPTSLSVNGRWLGIASPGIIGGMCISMRYSDNSLLGDCVWENAAILND